MIDEESQNHDANSSRAAKQNRELFKSYFVSAAGEVAWQYKHGLVATFFHSNDASNNVH